MTIDNEGRDWQWCPECRRKRLVVDEHEEASLQSGYMKRSTTEVGYWVTDFQCGHSVQRRSGRDITTRDPL